MSEKSRKMHVEKQWPPYLIPLELLKFHEFKINMFIDIQWSLFKFPFENEVLGDKLIKM